MARYFNEQEFQYAIKLLEKNPFLAKERFENYLMKYPKDYYARAYYVILLTRICMFNEAEIEYNAIIKESHEGSFYAYNAKRLNGFRYNMLLAKIKILGAKEKYDELYNLYYENYQLLHDSDRQFISYYCRNHLGLINKNGIESQSYRFNQSINYQEALFRNHINKHLADYNQNIDEPNDSIFATDFPIDKKISEIKKYIPSNKRLFLGYFDDSYYFKYDNCGRINNKLTNYFKVVTFHNTNHFITMCPTNDCEYFPFIDLNELVEENSEVKVKRLSQIDKFNKKFRRN